MKQPKFWALGAWHRGKPRPLALQLARETMFSAEAIEAMARQFDYLSEDELSKALTVCLDLAAAYSMSLDCAVRELKKYGRTCAAPTSSSS